MKYPATVLLALAGTVFAAAPCLADDLSGDYRVREVGAAGAADAAGAQAWVGPLSGGRRAVRVRQDGEELRGSAIRVGAVWAFTTWTSSRGVTGALAGSRSRAQRVIVLLRPRGGDTLEARYLAGGLLATTRRELWSRVGAAPPPAAPPAPTPAAPTAPTPTTCATPTR